MSRVEAYLQELHAFAEARELAWDRHRELDPDEAADRVDALASLWNAMTDAEQEQAMDRFDGAPAVRSLGPVAILKRWALSKEVA